jgi:2-phospho-L-lactate transferase/gluconeogenesis factor (CofD/UPF0052 family)
VLQVVVFTGGRGSDVLSRRLLGRPDVRLTLAVNGYDDGASTGEVRRFLGDALGPSDFRKNASRVAEAIGSCSPALITTLDRRLPMDLHGDAAAAALTALVVPDLKEEERRGLHERLETFLQEWRTSGRRFTFADCAIGNLVFAGSYLRCQRSFNRAVDDYTALVGLAPGIVDNVTDGTNACLVAIDSSGAVLGTEEAIVDSKRATRIADIFLVDRPLGPDECARLTAAGPERARAELDARSARVGLSERLAARIDAADVIVYAPGTQYSSLFPSYLTPGLGDRLAGNLRAIKLLITNLESDAEISGASAVALVERALYYLTDKGTRPRPAPCLITHYLINDPRQVEKARPYVPLGQVESFEDPRLVRIGSYEEGVTGRHDASKVLEPFIEAKLTPPARTRIGVLLYGAATASKIAETLLEMVRADQPIDADVTVFLTTSPELQTLFEKLPFRFEPHASDLAACDAVRDAVTAGRFDFVALFDSSSMYRGDDFVALFRYIGSSKLDAIWGSRRLSLRDIEQAYRYHYYQNPLMRAVSRVGSHFLSLVYLTFFGRYVADTLSGARVVRSAELAGLPVPFNHKLLNAYLLPRLLRRRADLLEVPVQFIPLSPERVRRTGVMEGLRSVATVVWQRFAPVSRQPDHAQSREPDHARS